MSTVAATGRIRLASFATAVIVAHRCATVRTCPTVRPAETPNAPVRNPCAVRIGAFGAISPGANP
ncbi:hypothetical protein AK37_22066 [Rhodococcus pyridinivorans AK37]|uniref:Uncharacterized protein n=1 Tax=Rhodococcus pyridinivorans AK37 TaxID=1114960 RepID=H0JXD6_9NOCA|nr:hypothetical protein AK37_22066 [Rhodococcus pyridinivorans AK37]